MRASALIVLVLVCSSAQAGQLFDPQGQTYWDSIQAAATGKSVDFSEILDIGGIYYGPGATIAYVDLFGTASSLSLYKFTDESGGTPNPFTANTWIYPVATDASPAPLADGWTRFDFRALKLLVKFPVPGTPNFEGGGGPMFLATNGSFSAVANQEQIPMQTGAAYYVNMPSGFPPTGPIPIFRVIWESLDAPYTAENGDANQDGRVDLTDFGILKASFGQQVGFRLVADFNGDSFVNFNDFERLKENFGWKAPAAAVPESSAAVLALTGLAALLCLRR